MSPREAASQASLKSARCFASGSESACALRPQNVASRTHARIRKHHMFNRVPCALGRSYTSESSHANFTNMKKTAAFTSIDPATGEKLKDYPQWDSGRLDQALDRAAAAAPGWDALGVEARCAFLRRAGELLLRDRAAHAELISREMGKLIAEARAEIEKCADTCSYYAEHAPRMLADEEILTDASRSLVAYQPLGVLLAIMPWNFPYWQAIR